MPPICLCLKERTLHENIGVANSHSSHTDILELRADLLDPEELAGLPGFPERTGKPVILSLCRTAEGGGFAGSNAERAALFERCLDAGYRWFDWDLDFRPPALRKRIEATGGPGILRSFLDKAGTPENLNEIVLQCAGDEREVPRITVTPQCTEDLFSLLDASKLVGNREGVFLGIGPWGFPSRVLPAFFGSMFTVTASPAALDLLYRVRTQSGKTAVFGILGNPVMHSRSPLIHNAGFDELGLDCVYVPFQTDNLSVFFRNLRNLGIRGLSVTVPHKEGVVSLLDEVGEEVTAIGACNTVVERGGRFRGRNYDAQGFLEPLHALWDRRGKRNSKALVVGAGGAARAVVYALKRDGLDVCITNRTFSRAQALSEEFGCSAAVLDGPGLKKAEDYTELIVQTGSAGMHPNEHLDPLDCYHFRGDETVYEIVYAPRYTKLLRRAESAGCDVLFGESMLLAQGMLQFREFTGYDYPLGASAKYDGIF